LSTSVIKKLPKESNRPIGRKFAQSGHPANDPPPPQTFPQKVRKQGGQQNGGKGLGSLRQALFFFAKLEIKND
jgi:hypothetical protein